MTPPAHTPKRWTISTGFPLAAGVVVLAVAATLLAIRAGDDDSPTDVLTRVSDAIDSAGSYRFKMQQGLPTGADGPAASVSMEGAADVDKELTRFVMTTRGPGFNVRCTQIASKKTVYMSVHPSRRAQVGATWLRSNTDAILAGTAIQFRPDLLSKDPSRFFKDIERTGTETIRGFETTRYEGTIDFASLFPRQSTAPPPTGFDLNLPFELFVDERGLMHRVTMEVRAKQLTTGAFRTTMDYFDFGEPVDIKLPPPHQVKDGTAQQTFSACFPGG